MQITSLRHVTYGVLLIPRSILIARSILITVVTVDNVILEIIENVSVKKGNDLVLG